MFVQTNFCRSGAMAAHQATIAEVALRTLKTLQHTVPCSVPGIMFLSGGMTEENSSETLNDVNKTRGGKEDIKYRIYFTSSNIVHIKHHQ